ncbi:hypothetical protein EMCRGX_G014236 [Ephydatia muelleri]
MADSDEDSERSRSRDKFRRERSDYGDKARRNDHRERKGAWRDESGESRRRSRDEYEDDRERRRYSPYRGREWGSPPPMKRRREGWEAMGEFPGMMPPYGMMAPRPPWMHPDMAGGPHPMGPPGQVTEVLKAFSGDHHGGMMGGGMKQMMLTFKQFLGMQDDTIDDKEAIQKYNEYKTEFRRKQISEFFEVHKEEDCAHFKFISKYHPTTLRKQKDENEANLKKRLDAFQFLLGSGRLDNVPLSTDCTDKVIKVMDTAVVRMEGGSDTDLELLESLVSQKPPAKSEEGEEEKMDDDGGKAPEESPAPQVANGSSRDTPVKRRNKKRDRTTYSEDESESSSDSEPEQQKEKEEHKESDVTVKDNVPSEATAANPAVESSSIVEVPLGSHALPETGQTENQTGGDQAELPNPSKEEAVHANPAAVAEAVVTGEPVGPKPSVVSHITHSIYLKHIHPRISADDVIEVCKKLSGFLRVAFADPLPEKGYARRGWVTFSSEVNIKDMCAKLANTKIKDQLINCQVNRELSRRVKMSAPLVWARSVVQSDLQLALQLVQVLDERSQLWEHTPKPARGTGEVAGESEEVQGTGEVAGESEEVKCNPLVSMATLLLKQEEPVAMVTAQSGGGEEEEGAIADPSTDLLDNSHDKLKVLDKLLWYLRIVHSLDFYTPMFFPVEDRMPHRCGIVTARGSKPKSIKLEEVNEYMQGFLARMKPLLEKKEELSDEEMDKFGKKDAEAEIERFIDVNTQQLSESKYLCPLSGKKFKAAEFVRKHIFNKHGDKIDDVRLETEFFNNYLKDPNRPMPFETSMSSPLGPSDEGRPSNGGMGMRRGPPWQQAPQLMGLPRGGWNPEGGFPPPGPSRRGHFGPPRGGGGGGPRGGRRKLIKYNDLDAPGEAY